MLFRSAVAVLALVMLALAGSPLEAEEGAGARDLTQGREALARRDYPAALEHLKNAVRALDPARDGAALGDAWLQLGIAWLNGLGKPEEALPAFLASAAVSPEPSTAWLWASVAAEKLGRAEEAAAYRMRAVAPPAPAPPPPPAQAPAPEAPAPEAQPAEPSPAPAAPAPEPAPDAIQHFFGPESAQEEKKEEEPTAAVEQPGEESGEAPAPAAEAPSGETDAVQHFFGESEPAPEAKPEEKAKDQKDGEKEKVDAFEYFFGEKKKEAPAEEKPPRR